MSSRPLTVRRMGKPIPVTVQRPARKLNKRQRSDVKRLIALNQEPKYFPVYAGYASVNTSGTITKWTTIPQGDTNITRDGQEIVFKSIDLRYSVFSSAAAVMIGNAFRIIVFQWRPDDNLDNPGLSQILDSSFTQPCFAPYNHNTRQKFKVLYDRLHAVYNGGVGEKAFHALIPAKKANKHIRYVTGNTGTNMIFVLVISDAAIQTPSWSYGAYVNFTDS